MDFNAWLVDVTGEIDGFMYTYILLILLVAVGVYFTVRTKGVQIRFIKDMFKQLTEKKHVQGERSISSFQALMVSTASRVGTGNIAGVATAIATGGPGAVFWMWLMALVGAASAFVESTLAQIWKVGGPDCAARGGQASYSQQALGSRKLGVLFSVLLYGEQVGLELIVGFVLIFGAILVSEMFPLKRKAVATNQLEAVPVELP